MREAWFINDKAVAAPNEYPLPLTKMVETL